MLIRKERHQISGFLSLPLSLSVFLLLSSLVHKRKIYERTQRESVINKLKKRNILPEINPVCTSIIEF
jgi:hypothetical protein